MTRLERLQELDYKLVQEYIDNRSGATTIPEDLREYVVMMSATSTIIHFEGSSQTRVCGALQKSFPGISYSQAKDIYYDAINFFYIDDQITAEAWDNLYADTMENLARLAIADNKLDVAFKAFAKAHELRIINRTAKKPSDWKPPVYVLGMEITPEMIGCDKQSVFDIKRRNEDRKLLGIITELQTTEKEKKRLMKEAQIVEPEPEHDDDGE